MPLFSAPRWIRYPFIFKAHLFVHLDFCVKTCQDQRTSPLLPLYPGIPPHQFWCHSDSPVLRQNCKTEYHHVITCRIMQSAFLKNSSFKQSPSVARPFKKPATSPLFLSTATKNNSRILRARCFIISSVHASLGGKHTLSTDAACTASSENIVRNSNLSSSFIFSFIIILCSKSLMSYTPALSAVI